MFEELVDDRNLSDLDESDLEDRPPVSVRQRRPTPFTRDDIALLDFGPSAATPLVEQWEDVPRFLPFNDLTILRQQRDHALDEASHREALRQLELEFGAGPDHHPLYYDPYTNHSTNSHPN